MVVEVAHTVQMVAGRVIAQEADTAGTGVERSAAAMVEARSVDHIRDEQKSLGRNCFEESKSALDLGAQKSRFVVW